MLFMFVTAPVFAGPKEDKMLQLCTIDAQDSGLSGKAAEIYIAECYQDSLADSLEESSPETDVDTEADSDEAYKEVSDADHHQE